MDMLSFHTSRFLTPHVRQALVFRGLDMVARGIPIPNSKTPNRNLEDLLHPGLLRLIKQRDPKPVVVPCLEIERLNPCAFMIGRDWGKF